MGSCLSSPIERRVMMIGLDRVGKTTILFKFRFGDIEHAIPSIGLGVETLEHKGICLNVWDLGGQEKILPVWRHFYEKAQGIIFVIDSTDRDRLEIAKVELQKILHENLLCDAAILIYANKQDLSNVMTASELTESLGLCSETSHEWKIQPCCALTGAGLDEGFNWLKSTIENKYR